MMIDTHTEATSAVRRHSRDGSAIPARDDRGGVEPIFQIRTADIEPYVGLRYLSKLFRLIALLLVLVLIAEVVTGFMRQGTEAIPTLVAEASRLIVLAALLWGIGDLALVLIDAGHDLRATRILLGRLTTQMAHPHPEPTADPAPPQPSNRGP
jgi:hypothetical protein